LHLKFLHELAAQLTGTDSRVGACKANIGDRRHCADERTSLGRHHEFESRIHASSTTAKEAIMPSHRTSIPTAVAASAAPNSHIARKYACLLLCGLSLALGVAGASAEELSVDEMACALDPQCTTPFVDRRLRGITTTPSVRTPGSFDRTVNFAFDSVELTADARKELDAVAESLTHVLHFERGHVR
jgi:hypothetical protein